MFLLEKQQALLEIYKQLGKAEKESKDKVPTNSHDDLINKMRNKSNE